MSSKGPQPSTSNMDGQDHTYRQRIASHYQLSALTKSRLKYCIFFHYFLSFAMLAKLAPYILDSFNWFILAIEELEVPEPLAWEWFWLSSILASVFCLDGIKKNSIWSMKLYVISILLLGYVPLLYAIAFYMSDVLVYLLSDDYWELIEVMYWKEYPYGLLWYGFILLALQVHSFSMYFTYTLICAWKARGTRRAE